MIVSYNLWLERFETGEQTKRTDDRGKDADRVVKLFPIVNNGNKSRSCSAGSVQRARPWHSRKDPLRQFSDRLSVPVQEATGPSTPSAACNDALQKATPAIEIKSQKACMKGGDGERGKVQHLEISILPIICF
jgi:hypothetical protein